MNILLVHIKKNRLPGHILSQLRAHNLTVITEPGHLQSYGPGVDVRLVDNVQDIQCLYRETLAVLRERPIDRIFMPFELGQAQAAFLRSSFAIPGIGFETALALTNKYVMKLSLAEAGLPQTRFALAAGVDQLPDVGDQVGWPVIVKPAVGGGSLDIFRLESRKDALAFADGPGSAVLRELPYPLVVETAVQIRNEYHCDGIVQDGTVLFAKASQYQGPVLGHGEEFSSRIMPDEDPRAQEMMDLHRRAVAATGLKDGVTHMEFFDTGEEFLASEIACRPAGGGIPHAIALMTGVDLWQACLDLALGVKVTIPEPPQADPIMHWYLSAPPGTIVAMTDPAELLAIEHVVDVVVNFQVGDEIPARQNSAFAAMQVFAQVASPAQAQRIKEEIYSTFTVEVSP